MPTEATLVARVKSALNDPSGQRFPVSTSISTELKAEARALFASPRVPSDMILGLCEEADISPDTEGKFTPPESYLRICTGYLGGHRIDTVIVSGKLPKPMTAQEIATISHPSFYIEGPYAYVLPPGAFSEVTGTILFVPEDFDLATIPPSFEDAIVYGAASRLAYNAGERMLGEILESRAATHLMRVIGGDLPVKEKK